VCLSDTTLPCQLPRIALELSVQNESSGFRRLLHTEHTETVCRAAARVALRLTCSGHHSSDWTQDWADLPRPCHLRAILWRYGSSSGADILARLAHRTWHWHLLALCVPGEAKNKPANCCIPACFCSSAHHHFLSLPVHFSVVISGSVAVALDDWIGSPLNQSVVGTAERPVRNASPRQWRNWRKTESEIALETKVYETIRTRKKPRSRVGLAIAAVVLGGFGLYLARAFFLDAFYPRTVVTGRVDGLRFNRGSRAPRLSDIFIGGQTFHATRDLHSQIQAGDYIRAEIGAGSHTVLRWERYAGGSASKEFSY